jgi:thymidylate synthase ThyX
VSEESYTPEERRVLARYFTNLDDDVFALTNLPEVVKGALFARYSRSSKPLRRLFLDEFTAEADRTGDDPFATPAIGSDPDGGDPDVGRAERLYERVFDEYGDDSVAQLGGAHVAVENASNLLTKQLEWGRLAAYLEQSTRYIPYDTKVDGRYRYYVDPEIAAGPHGAAYTGTLDAIFDTYAALLPPVLDHIRGSTVREEGTSEAVWRNATRARALDILRGLLPAATSANVGIYATGQSYEQMLLRLRSSGLHEARAAADLLLTELRHVIPSFLTRVDRPDRGVVWSRYLAETRDATRAAGRALVGAVEPDQVPEVTLVDWSPRDPEDALTELITGMLYPHVGLPEDQLRRTVAVMPTADRLRVVDAYTGERRNRRHKPGRALERLWYRFDVLGDYGAFRDLQRHRMLTIEWQDLTTAHGYETPPELDELGLEGRWHEALERSAELHARLLADHPLAAQYAVCFAYRIRYVMQLNARAALHLIELRSSPQGHPAYRRVAQRMHALIGEVAGHRAVAEAMTFVDHSEPELERLDAERRAERRRIERAAVDEA